ncbi:ABC transporter permease [Edaphobacter bradus]|uniref:ABC transporter permease n=1 Tax=Edaphobacter bradus TaxID=2259016 RepID=UPI0021DFBD20|nr:ABC transporter permease [Edaphobacter bradus]
MPAFIRRYLALLAKEVDQLRRNRVLLIQLMLPPTIVLVIFGYALNPKVRDLRMGIVDESFTTESRDFVDSLTENVNFNVARRYTRVEEAEDALKSLDLDLFIVIPTDFARTLQRGQAADVQVVIDAVDANTAQIAKGYLQLALEDYNSGHLSPADVGPRRRIMLVNAGHPAAPPGAPDVQAAYLYNPGLVASWHYVTGVMSIIMFINASLVASALAVKEKETGTIEQLLMTPAQTGEMLFAKTTPVFVVMMVVLFLSLGVGMLVFDLPVRGAVWLFALAGGLAALAGIGIGVTIATVSQSQQQAQLLTFFVNPPLTLLSGATSPLENMPDFFQKLSYLDPLRYMVMIVRGVTLKNAPWEALWPNLLALVVFAIVLFSFSAWRFRKH